VANTIRIKRSTATSAPTSLANAELAYSESSNKLFIGVGTGGVGGSATSIVAIGGTGAYLTLDTSQTVSGNKTFTGSVDLTGATATASTVTSSDSSTKLATTAFVKAQNYLTGNQSITFSGDASGSGTTSVSLTLASVGTAGTYTKVTTDAKGRVTSGTTLSASDIPDLSSTYLPTTGGTISSNLIISGDLTVNGTTTTVNSTTLDVKDKNIVLGNVTSPTDATADGGGITLKGATDKTFNWVNATDSWTSSEDIDLASGKAYRVNGTIVLSGSGLGSGVTSSSLTSVGTLTSGTWAANTISVAYGGTGSTSLTGLVKGNGTSAFTAAVDGTDYLSPSSEIDGGTF
jgi:hypothetical protein